MSPRKRPGSPHAQLRRAAPSPGRAGSGSPPCGPRTPSPGWISLVCGVPSSLNKSPARRSQEISTGKPDSDPWAAVVAEACSLLWSLPPAPPAADPASWAPSVGTLTACEVESVPQTSRSGSTCSFPHRGFKSSSQGGARWSSQASGAPGSLLHSAGEFQEMIPVP